MSTRLADFGITDYSALMDLVPRTHNIFEDLGIVSEADTIYGTQEVIEFERVTLGEDAMAATARGADRDFAGDDEVQKESFRIPFFTNDKVTTPNEVQGFREWGTEDAPASVDALVNRRIARIQRNHAKLRRDSFYTALIDNKVHAKNKAGADTALAKNFSTVWGQNRNTGAIDLTTAANDPFAEFEKARQNVIAKAGDDADEYEMVVLVNSKQFQSIISHDIVEAAYANYASEQEPLRKRLSGNKNNRIFRHKGIVLVEDISGKIADAKCFAFPMGIANLFAVGYAPADTIEHANTTAQASYLFMVEKARSVAIESETSMAVILTRPELITDISVTM